MFRSHKSKPGHASTNNQSIAQAPIELTLDSIRTHTSARLADWPGFRLPLRPLRLPVLPLIHPSIRPTMHACMEWKVSPHEGGKIGPRVMQYRHHQHCPPKSYGYELCRQYVNGKLIGE